ncbi:L-aminopeptidase/D-esterase-like protein [Kribbella sp. VKM Ac-2571]|uniref:P1 family peptidase n=1 Tax=Kribbella sp. VKM Ac-2571 TaxID=2512222 RepID=UPI00106025AD|nr:P1 family peptidase [Kribbella sp. VKM Ac-2571]TDO51247.1 L-aminopeptidase/D-esterase-like protein [Kribbella sp. VKM Ac-2571]
MQPGPQNAITDVPGILVGQVERVDPPYLTGTTVVHVPGTAVAGVDVRGGAPGTRETDLLAPVNSNGGVNAIVLTGGSAFGLDTAGSVMRWLEERGEGVRVGQGEYDVVPIVPTAVIFDLARGGDFKARPEPSWGADAIAAATDGPVALGNHGAGAGARARSLKGGVGSASVRLDDGTTVGALVIVNAAGSAVDADGNLYGARLGLGDEFTHLRTPVEPPPPAAPGRNLIPGPAATTGMTTGMNTVIAVVATDVPLDKAATQRMAMVAHDGLARAIDPVHTLVDGDSIFALSTRTTDEPRLSVTDPLALGQLETVYAAGARTLSRAIVHAMLNAESVQTPAGTVPSYRDAYPSAFRTD